MLRLVVMRQRQERGSPPGPAGRSRLLDLGLRRPAGPGPDAHHRDPGALPAPVDQAPEKPWAGGARLSWHALRTFRRSPEPRLLQGQR